MSAESLIRAKGTIWTVERRIEATDAAGSVTWTWSTHIAGARIFVQPQSGSEAVRYGRENSRKFHLAYAPVSLDVRPADQLRRGSRTLDVQSVRKAGEFTSGPMAHLVIEAQETDGGT